ncbi:response regulator transcription factor [Rhodoferax sp. AJA081-3]|uniref:response regulator transcription factor n=1 Tax=Rhodoferax sp. AJA081-3 TaxID=2752316 RepID=UPI001ADF8D06|nr:response regulator transcription factor [Rhodoferax sp. AJA081-3]
MHTNIALAPVSIESSAIKMEVMEAGKGLLSRREQEVLELVSRGFSYAEIADLKSLSVHTIQTHIKSLYGKLEVHSKMEAVLEATRMGLLPRQAEAAMSK